jgi:hypothetical protein
MPILSKNGLPAELSQGGSHVAEVWVSCLGWKFSIELIESRGSAEWKQFSDADAPSPNRREFTRVTVDLAMAIVAPEKTIRCGRVRDISMNGICCECSETLPIGQRCRVVLFLGDPNESINVEAEAVVVRAGEGGPEDSWVAVELCEVNLESFHHICALVLNNAADELDAERELRNHLGIRSLRQ